MQKIVILGAGSFQLGLINKARELGLYVIVITPPGDYPGISLADKVYYHDAKDGEFVKEVAAEEKADGIISDQGEIFVRPIAYATEKLGLPGNPYGTALIYTDKNRMRMRSRELGLPTIDSRCVSSVEEAKTFFRELGANAIVKPADSFSSKGVYKVCSEQDIDTYLPVALDYSPSATAVIERFINGKQYEVDSFAVNGQVETLMYADLDEFKIPNVFSSKTRLYPADLDEETAAKLLDFDLKIQKGFGMQLGLSHSEYIIDDESGEIYLMEAALRGGGTFIASDICRLQTGVDTADFLVKAALGKLDSLPEHKRELCHCGYVCFYLPAGEVVSLDGVKEVMEAPFVARSTLGKISAGMVTGEIADKNQRHAVVLSAETREGMMERIDWIRNTIRVKVKTEKGIEGPLWD